MIRRTRAGCRDQRSVEYLEEVPARTLDELHDRISHVERQCERRIDLADVLATLPADDQSVAFSLRDHPLTEVAQMTGRSRQSLRSSRSRIRRHLQKAGVGG